MTLGTRVFSLVLVAVIALSALAATASAQGSTVVVLTIPPEASIRIDSSGIQHATAAEVVNTTSFTYRIRTSKLGGAGRITAQVDLDPAVAGSVEMVYTAAVSGPGFAPSGRQRLGELAELTVASFGPNAHSAKTGNAGSFNLILPKTVLASATVPAAPTVTFTISAN